MIRQLQIRRKMKKILGKRLLPQMYKEIGDMEEDKNEIKIF